MFATLEINLVVPPNHPGAVVAALIEDWGTTPSEVSQSMGRPEAELQAILDGRNDINDDMAEGLSHALELPAYVFRNLQSNCNLRLAKFNQRQRAAD